MRAKDEILDECFKLGVKSDGSRTYAHVKETLNLEVLIDIRDILNGQLIDLEKTTRESIKIPK